MYQTNLLNNLIFQGLLATSCYKNNLSNTSSYGFCDYMLNNWTIIYMQELFGYGLSSRKQPCSKSSNWNNSFG